MNKKLIAIAIAGALAAPLAAQAEVTIYGTMDVSIDSINNDVKGNDTDSSLAASSNSSNIGFKGAEDLGGGMKAIWQAEAGVNPTDANNGGSNSWAARNTIVGLAGGFGTFVLGRHDTPYKVLGIKGQFFVNGIGDTRTLTNIDAQDARANNVIAYISPNMNGVSLFAAYVTDLAGSGMDNTDNGAYSVSLSYANGPLFIGVANQKIKQDGVPAKYNTVPDADPQATRVVASYKLGGLKVAANWQQDKNVAGLDGFDNTGWGLGAAYTMGNNTVKAMFQNAGEFDNTDKTGATKWAIGIDHAMSKQTTLYAAYAATSNDDNAFYSVTGAADGHGDSGPQGTNLNTIDASNLAATDVDEPGNSPTAFSIGIKHKF